MGEDTIDDKSVDGYDEHGDQDGDDEGEWDWYSFLLGIRVLNCIVRERKVLVERCDDSVNCRIEDSENAAGGIHC